MYRLFFIFGGMEITFKKCGLHHLEKLRALSRTTFVEAFKGANDPDDFQSYLRTAFSKTQLEHELKNPDSHFYFVNLSDETIGYLKINIGGAQSEFKDELGMELERIYVISSFQGQGFGEMMLDFVEAEAQGLKKAYLWLGVWERNTRAIKFYERNGYAKFDTHPYYIGKDKQTDWLLKKRLQ